MSRILPALVLGATLITGAASAQTGPGAGSPSAKPQVTTAPMAPAVQPTTTTTTTIAPTPSVTTPAITPATAGDATPLRVGANSFTMDQARRLMEDNGFTAVSDLRKDDQSIWRAKATKDGQNRLVSVDFKGTIVSE